MKQKSLILAAVMISIWNAFSQGTFQDLDFEQATIVPVQTGISAAAAFPGWQAYFSTVPLTAVGLDGLSSGGAAISLINNDPSAGAVPLNGNYSVDLFSSTEPSIQTTSLSQTGIVPVGTQSIQMDAVEAGGTFTVALNGQTINMIPWQTLPNYTVYAGNISAWSGQSANLSITENAAGSPDLLELDDISFSPNPITVTPEPDAFTLMSIGGLLFGIYRRFAPKPKSS